MKSIILDRDNILDIDVDVENSSVDKLTCIDVLDYVDKTQYLPLLVAKMRHKANLTIEGTNLGDVSLAIIDGHAFDHKKYLYDNRHSTHTVEDVLKMLTSAGLDIVAVKLANYKYSIIAERP